MILKNKFIVNLKTKIKNIANIQSGLFTRPTIEGDIVYLQAKHFNENGILSSDLHPDLKPSAVTEKHLLKPGDVLFAAKGSKNFATWYESKNPPAVASTSFFVIRINDNYKNTILPEFLTWCLNNPNSQIILKRKAKGTAIASISKTALVDLEISIPDIQSQKVILEITQLRKREKQLKQQIEDLREKQIQQLILNGIR